MTPEMNPQPRKGAEQTPSPPAVPALRAETATTDAGLRTARLFEPKIERENASGARKDAGTEAARMSDASMSSFTFGYREMMHGTSRLLMTTYPGFMARIKLSSFEGMYHHASRELAVVEAQRAYRKVEAYRQFVDARCDWNSVRKFSDLPETDKKSFIKPFAEGDKLALYVDRTIPAGSSWDTSTGTSGKPTSWYRGPREVADAYAIMGYRAHAILGRGSYAFINGFALGPWATGITAARGVGSDPRSVTYNVGAQPQLMLQLIEESRALAPNRPIVVAGYPPHMEQLVYAAREQGICLHDHQILAVVGGEGMSEPQRERMECKNPRATAKETGFREVFSFYGASDIDINLAFETRFEVALRRALVDNPNLARRILGESYPFVPMVFHYDPLNHLIEVNEKKQLLFTELSGHRISPRVRYNLGDVGTVRRMSEVREALRAEGVTLPEAPLSNLPLLFVWGRVDDGLTYRGANLAWENLEEAIRRLGIGDAVKGFGLMQYETADKVRTEFLLHAPDAAHHRALLAEGRELTTKVIKTVSALNHDFAHQVGCVTEPEDLPAVRLYRDDSPMAAHSRENPSRKQQHIFLGKDAAKALEIDGGGSRLALDARSGLSGNA